MKATINGITYEGTYDEITAIVDRMEIKIGGNPYMPIKEGFPADWLVRYPKQPDTVTRTTTGNINIKRCEGACYYTGACEQPRTVTAKLVFEGYKKHTVDPSVFE